MQSIKVMDELAEFLEVNIYNLCEKNKIKCDIHYASNVQAELDRNKMTAYVSRQMFREEQDTLAVDVVDFGKRRYTSYGAMAVSFFMPRTIKNGYFIMETIAQNLKNILRAKSFNCLWVRDVMASPHLIENNCYRYDLTFSYLFDEIV